MPRYCLTLDLKESPEAIESYKRYHAAVWPEVLKSLHDSGVSGMEIYLLERRLFMIMDVVEGFSFERKAEMDAANEIVQQWETLMGQFQAEPEDGNSAWRWRPMEKVFDLHGTE